MSDLKTTVDEARAFVRAEAKKRGLPGKGKCYSDKHKKSWSVKVGLGHGHRWRPRPTQESNQIANQEELLQEIIELVNEKYGELFTKPAEVVYIKHGSCGCCGSSHGIRMLFRL